MEPAIDLSSKIIIKHDLYSCKTSWEHDDLPLFRTCLGFGKNGDRTIFAV